MRRCLCQLHAGLGAQHADLPGLERGQRLTHERHEGQQLRDPIGPGAEDEDGKRAAGQVLLVGQVPVRGEEDVVLPGDPVEQRAVVEIAPAAVMGMGHVEIGERPPERPRDAGIEEEAHGPGRRA